jgi:hypothetical protein
MIERTLQYQKHQNCNIFQSENTKVAQHPCRYAMYFMTTVGVILEQTTSLSHTELEKKYKRENIIIVDSVQGF